MKMFRWHLLALLVSWQSLFGIIRIEEATNPPPCRAPRYAIFDMGATEVDPALMNPYAMPHSYAPRLNNQRQVAANRADEGYFRDLNHGELVPQIGYCLRGHAYGINDVGDIISTLERDRDHVDWVVWTLDGLRKKKRYAIEPGEIGMGRNIDLRAINNQKWAVGYLNPGCALRPLVWNPNWGLKPFGFYVGWDFKGAAFGINNKGTILGYISECEENPPFVWNERGGLEILRHYRIPLAAQSCHEIRGPVHFVDMVITDDDYVYGTLWIDDNYEDGTVRYYGYRWEPYNHDFRYLDLEGMRINGANCRHTLVGAIDGRAALRERGAKPMLLADYLKNDDWELIEATDVNDHGDIVGYGKYQGKMHIFLMKKD